MAGFFLISGFFMVGFITPEMLKIFSVREMYIPLKMNMFVGAAFAFIAGAAVYWK